MNIDDLKIKCTATTTEELYGIVDQPINQCMAINDMIKRNAQVNSIEGSLNAIKSEHDIEHVDGHVNDIEWMISDMDIENELEELRAACEDLREWGLQWKNLAKQIMEDQGLQEDYLQPMLKARLEAYI